MRQFLLEAPGRKQPVQNLISEWTFGFLAVLVTFHMILTFGAVTPFGLGQGGAISSRTCCSPQFSETAQSVS